jgi:glycosyltransferase involved in cell wall biosynthesis
VRALLATYSDRFGGAERLLLDRARRLDLPGQIACPPGALEQRARAAGLEVLALSPRPLQRRGGPARELAAAWHLGAHARELRAAVRASRPNVLLAVSRHSVIAAPIALAALRGPARPGLVAHLDDTLPAAAIAHPVRAAARRADAVIAVSRTVARDADPGGRLGDRLHVIHPGVEIPEALAAPDASVPPTALLLGAIVAWKRPGLALDAVASVPGARLLVAGAPLDREGEALLGALRTRAAAPDLAGRVEFLGPVDEPWEALRRAHVLIHAADREPFGLVVAEALACGRPVVAAESGGPAEIAGPECARLFAPGDAAGAGAALAEVLAMPGHGAALGAAGRERVKRELDPGRAADRVAAVLAAVAR